MQSRGLAARPLSFNSPSYSGIRSSFAESVAVINSLFYGLFLDLESLCKLKKNLIYTNHSTLSHFRASPYLYCAALLIFMRRTTTPNS